MSNIRLAKCGHLIAQKTKNVDYIVCLARILTVGEYVDMNGTKVIVDEETLTKLVANYNSQIEEQFNKHQQLIEENSHELDPSVIHDVQHLTVDDFDGLPNQINHDMSNIRSTVGNVVGKMQLRKSMDKLAIFANIKVKGQENVCCVADNRWRNLSVSYNQDNFKWIEISWVIYGADPDANKVMSYKLSQPNVTMINTKFIEVAQKYNEIIYSLDRKIFIDKNLLKLCKLRKITKADAYFIEKELYDIKDLITLNKIFNILDVQLSIQNQKEKFISVDKTTIQDLHNTLKAVTYDTIYN